MRRDVCIDNLLNNNINKDSLLITDGERAYRKYAAENNVELQQIKGGRSTSKVYHIQTVNSYHSSLKRWFTRFNGVATKNLNNYLTFYKVIKSIKGDIFQEVSKLQGFTKTQDIIDAQMNLV